MLGNKKPAFFLVTLALLLFSGNAFSQLTQQEQDGVTWKKTLRIQGIITKLDPFNETKLYTINEISTDSIKISKNQIQFELIASTFWENLKDSIIVAIQNKQIDVYLPKDDPNRPGIPTKGIKITSYDLLLDELYLAYQKGIDFANVNRSTAGTYVLEKNSLKGEVHSDRMLQSIVKTKANVLSLLSMFQLEIILSVDETGFKIEPISLLFGATRWAPAPVFDPNVDDAALLKDYFSLFDKGFGLFIDLKAQTTYNFLVETGIQYSGEGNVIPFYDLITMFHYPYEFYSESSFVINNDPNSAQLKQLLINRYNETTFNYLYGQPPQWWDAYGKSSFMNGVYTIDSTFIKKK